MEAVIQDQTPLAEYLRDEGGEHVELAYTSDELDSVQGNGLGISDPERNVSPPASPLFAPVGRPIVRKRFRSKFPDPLRIDIPPMRRLTSLHDSYSRVVASRIDRADNLKFIEQFRYTIVASQLLSGHSIPGQKSYRQDDDGAVPRSAHVVVPTGVGLVTTALGALGVAWTIRWVYTGGYAHLTKKRFLFGLVVVVGALMLSHVYIRQQWLRYLREKTLAEVNLFVSRSQDFDSATSAAMSLIQEVELVSRGYRISAPLPPISRMEGGSQTRRCGRLRKALAGQFADTTPKYDQVISVVKGFSEQLELEKYYDIYEISDFDMSDARQGTLAPANMEDPLSLQSLKIAAARFHTTRKILLCTLLALEPTGDNSDFLRWSAVVESLRTITEVTYQNFERLRAILGEEGTFSMTPENKAPMSPSRERWRSQLRKLNSLSSGIRGLQAKLTLLREESDRSLNEAEDASELGRHLMSQYESIGQDLRMLAQAWEEGRAVLASGIDRNEKRLSSLSTVLMSPVSSLSGLTTVDEAAPGGGTDESLKALTGEGLSPPMSPKPPAEDEMLVFEAVAVPPSRPRSLLTREERLVKMREERERKEAVRDKADASRGMLRELEMVINLRPKRANTLAMPRTPPAPGRLSV